MQIVIDYVNKILNKEMGNGIIRQKDIGIVTPFRLQRSIILRAFEKKGWDDIAVGTVEIFQGQEKDVIILSSVRSTVFQNDGRFHIGFLSHKKVKYFYLFLSFSFFFFFFGYNKKEVENKKIILFCYSDLMLQ